MASSGEKRKPKFTRPLRTIYEIKNANGQVTHSIGWRDDGPKKQGPHLSPYWQQVFYDMFRKW